jgi:hypothetical protein
VVLYQEARPPGRPPGRPVSRRVPVPILSDPADVLRATALSRATVRRVRQNLFWASIYNVLAVPVAAGVCSGRSARRC